MDHQEIAAAVAAAHSVQLVVVGSTALRMNGHNICVKDLDLVVTAEPDNLDRLTAVFGVWGVLRSPTRRAMLEQNIVTLESSYGPIDLLLRTGRDRFRHLRSRAVMIGVAGVNVAVAAETDCWALRREFAMAMA